jgi:Zn-dependent protease with chaperone function
MTLLFSSILLGLAWFTAINLALSSVAWVAAPTLLRTRRLGAGMLLGVRLFPAIAAAGFVLGFFLPAHWRFEPAQADERFGLVLGCLAAVGAALIARSTWRAARACWRDRRLAELTRQAAALGMGAFEVGGLPGVSLAGLLRPRILVGSDALAALTPAELEVAISHERAHERSRDNLKRFSMFCAPDFFGMTAAARGIEERWQAESECQADARAVRGEHLRAVVLASALVKVARLMRRREPFMPSPLWSAFHVASLLETRVRRLVSGPMSEPAASEGTGGLLALTILAAAAAVAFSDLSFSLHAVTEAMVTSLP